jgi:MFS transporter, AAHS family, 4-hydroxybenzoate transporter
MIMVQFTGAPLGGFVGGLAVAALLAHFGWEVVFVIGGVFPLALVPVIAVWLRESPRFLARKPNFSSRQRALLARLGYALQTVLLWLIFICSLLNLFLFVYWLPEVLHLTGMTPPTRSSPPASSRWAECLRPFISVC